MNCLGKAKKLPRKGRLNKVSTEIHRGPHPSKKNKPEVDTILLNGNSTQAQLHPRQHWDDQLHISNIGNNNAH